MHAWSLNSWVSFSRQQTIDYPDHDELKHIILLLNNMPPLVAPQEIKRLKQNIARAGRNEAFILQGGDCAESFQDCRIDMIHNKLKIMQQMSFLLMRSMQKKIIQIGRIAGQYAKARSSNIETIAGLTLPSYRGDLINQPEFSQHARTPNPYLLLEGYSCASKTLDIIRALQSQPTSKDESFNFFTSHEALHLDFEQTLTRHEPKTNRWYALSTHLPWIGVRTNHIDSAHVEFLRGVDNPIGVKVGPDATTEWLFSLLNKLNPQREEGRILLICRLGTDKIHTVLPSLIQMTQEEKIPVTWSSDPMHGNTEITKQGIKTRRFDKILAELDESLRLHHEYGSHLGGVHFELTGEQVTECIGGSRGLKEMDLKYAYNSLVDPRLNYEQSLEIAMQLGLKARALTI
jgi:3-deoxy-7-phosphoheptulonate synthase